MKNKICSVAILLLIVLALTGCANTNVPVTPPADALNYDLFSADGDVYLLSYAGEYTYVSGIADAEECFRLPGGEHTLWSEQQRLLYYADGYKIYCCDPNGENKTPVWTLPDGCKKDIARVALAADGILLICAARGERNRALDSARNPYFYSTYEYYALDPATGQAQQLMDAVPYTDLPVFLGSEGTQVFYLQRTGSETVAVMCADLITSETRELGTISSASGLSSTAADACVLDSTLYFITGHSGIYTVPLSGGSVEQYVPDGAQTDGRYLPVAISEQSGKLYVLLWDSETYPTAMLCEWGPASGSFRNADSENRTLSEAEGFMLADGQQFYAFSGRDVTEGTLKD